MKNFYIGIILIALASCTSKEKKFQPDYRGDIASITVYEYTTKDSFGEIHKDELYAVYKLEFDNNKNLISKKKYEYDGEITEEEYNEYNKRNLLIIQKTYQYIIDSQEISEYIYDGDILEKLTIKTCYSNDKDITNWYIEYANDGKNIVEAMIFDDEKLYSVGEMKWDKNILTVKQKYTKDGSEDTYIYEFNDNRQITRVTNNEGKVSKITYNEMGLPIKYTQVYEEYVSSIDTKELM